jgi:hypothetical protein
MRGDGMPDENRARMTLAEAEKRLRDYPADGILYIVANEDGSFSIAGHKTPESKILEQPVYDIVVVATKKTTTKPGNFVHLMQQAAAEPITLRNLIHHLIDTYRPHSKKKTSATVIRARTLNAYTKMGYLRRHVSFRHEP